jgi:NADH dehydrogenase (ubiquinone) Fe-S protein 6
MASVWTLVSREVFPRTICRQIRQISSTSGYLTAQSTTKQNGDEVVTHTGQVWQPDDYRRARFVDGKKLVNTRFAIDLIAEDPVVICKKRVISSDSGGPLGHPKVFINLDKPGMHVCGYSGRKFVLAKYYDEKTMGPSISYSEYLRQIDRDEDD